MASRRGMGRGLAAILPEPERAGAELLELPVDTIRPNPDQPRRRFDESAISELAASISETGVIQPLLVRPLAEGGHELIAGERRWRAAREAGLETVPAIVRSDDERERLQIALVENMVREDLNPVEEARACADLVDDLGVSREELARRLGRSRSAISNLIRLLDLPDEAIELIEDGELSEGHGRAILQARGHDARRELARKAARSGWSVRETERRVRGEEPTSKRSRKVTPHPDQEAVLERAAEALEEAFGREVRLRAVRNGIRAELSFEDLDDARSFARRFRDT